MKGIRATVVLLVAAVALSLAVTLAVAAPSALSPTRSAAAAEYCPPGELDARQDAVDRAQARVDKAKATLAKYRAKQLKLRAKVKNAKARAKLAKAQNKAYALKVRNLKAFKKQLQAAEAKLSRCA
jgi:exonuclease VII large subunit